jgi:integrase
MTTKVTLRRKSILKGRESLYLDFYPPIKSPKTGKLTRREFLGFFIVTAPTNPLIKKSNKETIQIAEQIRALRENEINKPEIYTAVELERVKANEVGQRNFIAYFKKLADKKKTSNYDNWISAYHHLVAFTNGQLKFADLTKQLSEEFKEYLLEAPSHRNKDVKLSQNSAVSYFNKYKAALKKAYQDGLLSTNLNGQVKPIKTADTQRNFLTIEEVNKLAKTDCKSPEIKQAALFSILTGLRHIDIKKMVWGEIEYSEQSGYLYRSKIQKTQNYDYLPLPQQAVELLGERKDPAILVFEELTYSAYKNRHLKEWVKDAGITKKITFHEFRHTYATLQLTGGTDLYTVSKMLGHKSIKTTQIYAKIVDELKRKTTNVIRIDL